MRNDIGVAAARALEPVLLVFSEVEMQALVAVWRFDVDGCFDRIVFEFASHGLTIAAEPGDDTVILSATPFERKGGVDVSESWQDLIGAVFWWGWIAVNQQGYCDGVLLSFDGIDPQVLLNVIASSIVVRRIPTQRGR